MISTLRIKDLTIYSYNVGIKSWDEFIKMYIIIDKLSSRALIVDPGPSSSYDRVKSLINKLSGKGVRVEAILISHIHVDHYGLAPRLSKELGIPAYIHPRAEKHVVDPSRLWESTIKVLGNEALELGRPEALSREHIVITEDFKEYIFCEGNIKVLVVHTPGHAPHHQVFLVNDLILFSGDAVGGYDPEIDFSFTTSPPGLRFDLYVKSIEERIMKLNFDYVAPTHVGISIKGKELVMRHLRTMKLWFNSVKELVGKGVEPTLEDLRDVDKELDRFLKLLRMYRGTFRERIKLSLERGLRAIIEEVKRL